jgi:hypothetical protein
MFPKAVSAAHASTVDWSAPAPPDDRRQDGRIQGRSRSGTPAGIAPLQAVAPSAGADPISLKGLGACVEEARATALSPRASPPDPTFFSSLRARLDRACARLPEAYRSAVAEPLRHALDDMGPGGFARVLAMDPAREGAARLLLDVAQAVLQRGEGYQSRATSAFQEVVGDLYDGFLAAEDRRGVRPPDHGVTPPLVRWGQAESGPYTWPATATATFGVKAAVVSLPAANAAGGLLAWPALAHETAGHDILAADDGLRDELARAVTRKVLAAGIDRAVAGYWSERIDEAAADVLGVLNMGPSAALGMVGYFRALNGAWRGVPELRSAGREEDPHPADIARAYLAAETVRLLSFEGAGRWADRLIAEADRDLGRICLGDVAVSAGVARASAAAVAQAIVRTRVPALEGRSLGEIQDWDDRDEAIVATLRREMADDGVKGGVAGAAGATPGKYVKGAYAAHAVAAAVYEAVTGGSSPAQVMGRMVGVLAAMHERNPDWKAGPRRLHG